ncbi:MAG: glutamate--tRNA ligase family protein, partial [Patescibacteria group bacterium]
KITTVLRGEEWLSSTPKHLILYEMFGWQAPRFAHSPNLLNQDKTKLSKRKGDVSVSSYLERGYLKEAIVNFIATLGFNPTADREIYAEKELMRSFDISKVKGSGAVLNTEKLDWMNCQYIKSLSADDLYLRTRQFLSDSDNDGIDGDFLRRIITVEQNRAKTLKEIINAIDSYRIVGEYNENDLLGEKLDRKTAVESLKFVLDCINSGKVYSGSPKTLEESMKGLINGAGKQVGAVLWPFRVALSGKTPSPGPFEYWHILGNEETVNRIESAIQKLST